MPEPSTTLGFWGWLVANSQDIRNLVLAAAALVALPLGVLCAIGLGIWSAVAARGQAAPTATLSGEPSRAQAPRNAGRATRTATTADESHARPLERWTTADESHARPLERCTSPA